MLKPLFDIAPLLTELKAAEKTNGTLILTPNNRLASKISDAWGAQQSQPVWQPPHVYAIENWLSELWLQLQMQAWPGSERTLIEPAQERLLWERVIAEDDDKPPLLNSTGLAQSALRASDTLYQWRTSNDELAQYQDHPGLKLVLRWQQAAEQKSANAQLISRGHRIAQIKAAFEQGQLPKADKILLVDFQSLSPLYQSLLAAATDQVEDYQPRTAQQPDTQRRLVSCKEAQQELQQAALWAKQLTEANPESRIGIIIPDLPSRRQQVERVFREVFEPAYPLPTTDRYTPPFNISTASPMAGQPLVAAALALLQLNRYQLDLPHYQALLQSPFWGDDEQLPLRAAIIQALKKLGTLRPRTYQFRELCAKVEQALPTATETTSVEPAAEPATGDLFAETNAEPTLSSRLIQAENLRRQAARVASFQYWQQYFSSQLNALGWPGQRPLDSVEHQLLEQWQKMLERFSQLSQTGYPITLDEALSELERLAQTTPFQAETEDSPLQILGMLEGAGLRFDHLWMLGMDDKQWPAQPEPNPLLPVQLQRQQAMPRACAERELELAKQLLDTYCQRSADITFSFCQFDGDAEYQVSALLQPLLGHDEAPATTTDATLPALISQQLTAAPELVISDATVTPALQLEQEPLRGGTALFKDQANCPFNAFARWRLGALEPIEPTTGLSALERGTLLHDLLDQTWEQLDNQQNLLALDQQQQQDLLNTLTTQLLTRWRARKPELGDRYFELETERLCRLASLWLDMERERPAFTIAAREAVLDVTFAGLPLTLRLDRTDQLANNTTLLIDYKTGSPALSGWLGERPSEPQLPLYAVLLDPPPMAISYGIVNAKEQRLNGVAGQDNLLPPQRGRPITLPEWPEQLEIWHTRLTAIANEITNGDASITVYNQGAFSFQPELLPLNRWLEREQVNRHVNTQANSQINSQVKRTPQ